MQSAQLSLMPEQIPGSPPEVILSLPETGVAAAIRILARLIAHAATTTMTEASTRGPSMSDNPKVSAAHRQRAAIVYVRQSTLAQLERNRESTTRQYDLVAKAVALGWPRGAVRVIDEDQGISGSSAEGRSGFAELAAQVGLGQVGIVLALEVSRLARNNADWYRLLDLAGMTDTLIADGDGLYHPGLFNDRLVLGMKGTMSEAELHILRARLDGGVRNKAARGELKRALPVGLVWGEGPAEVLFHPDEAVTGVIAAVFERFAACGSARAVWLWLREQGLKWPLTPTAYLHGTDIRWVEPTYHAVHNVLTHPAYAGAYVYGRTKFERRLGEDGQIRTRRRVLPREQWQVLIEDHHRGYIDWDTYLANTEKIAANTRPVRHEPGTGAVREGCALLQGLAACGICGRKLAVFYQGPSKTTPGYYCTGTGALVDGRGTRHLQFGGLAIDTAVAAAFLAALAPAALSACLAAVDELEHGHDTVLAGHRRDVERSPLRRGQSGTPLPGRRPGQPAGRPRPGSRLGEDPRRAGGRRGRTGTAGETPPCGAERRRTGHGLGPR